jgi:hypothetical protein
MARFEAIPTAAALAKLAFSTSRLSIPKPNEFLIKAQSKNSQLETSENRAHHFLHENGEDSAH